MKMPTESKEWHKTKPGCWTRTTKMKNRRCKKGFYFKSRTYYEIICGYCHTLGVARKSKIDEGWGRFCSNRCAGKARRYESGEFAYTWKGGRRIDSCGYVLLYKPDHPNATKQGYVRENRLVASGMYGRPIAKGEVVHHMNADRLDNSQINLAVLTTGEHNAVHKRLRQQAREMK